MCFFPLPFFYMTMYFINRIKTHVYYIHIHPGDRVHSHTWNTHIFMVFWHIKQTFLMGLPLHGIAILFAYTETPYFSFSFTPQTHFTRIVPFFFSGVIYIYFYFYTSIHYPLRFLNLFIHFSSFIFHVNPNIAPFSTFFYHSSYVLYVSYMLI